MNKPDPTTNPITNAVDGEIEIIDFFLIATRLILTAIICIGIVAAGGICTWRVLLWIWQFLFPLA